MYTVTFLTFVCLIASSAIAQVAKLGDGNYTIGDPSSNEVVVSEGATLTPVRTKDVPQGEGVWFIELSPGIAVEPKYKVQYRGTASVAGTSGVPGSVVYTEGESNSPILFYIGLYSDELYQIAFDAYKVLVWTRHANNTVTLEHNEGSDNQMWHITASD